MNAKLSDERIVAIGLAASVVPDLDRPGEWNVTSVQLAGAYVVDGRPGPRYLDSLDVSSLSDLSRALSLPVDNWPHAELQITPADLRLEPESFGSGDHVTVVVTARNVGAELARVNVFIAKFKCSDVGIVLGQTQGRIPAGQAMTWRFEIMAPEAQWLLQANLDLVRVSQNILKYEKPDVHKGTSKVVGALKCGSAG